MRTLRRFVLWTATGIGVLILGLASLVYGPPLIQPLYLQKLRYEIPDGYRGWVQFEVGNPHCPPLTRDGRFLVYFVDPKGHGCTSDPIAEGWRTIRYEYVRPDGHRQTLAETGWGKGGLIWDEMYRSKGSQKSYVFFVGTEQQFHVAEDGPIE